MNRLPDDIVVITMSRWDGEVSSAIRSLARELARERRVWYIDHPVSLKDLATAWGSPALRRRRRPLLTGRDRVRPVPGMPDGFRAVTPPLTWPVNALGPGALYEAGSRANDRALNRCLARLRREEGIGDYLFLNSFDPFFFRRLTQDRPPALRIYQSRDDIRQEAYIARHGVRLEREQLDAADLRLATSRELCRLLSRPGKPVALLPNAADAALFRRALDPGPPPADWPCAGKPVVGYIGNLAELRMDYGLLDAAVAACPDLDFVFLGTGAVPDRAFARSANAHFIGPRPLEALPDYLRAMDVATIPFLRNTLTRSIYPLKINEYLAAGKPVVTTDFSEDVEAFGDVVRLSREASDWVPLLRRALADTAPERVRARVARAEENAWPLRAERFLDLCREALASPTPSPCPSPTV